MGRTVRAFLLVKLHYSGGSTRTRHDSEFFRLTMPSAYTEQEIEVALVHFVLSGGNATRAVRELKALRAKTPSASALNNWRRADPAATAGSK